MIGIIVKTDNEADELNEIWQPDRLYKENVNNAFINVLGYAPTNDEFTHDENGCLINFTIDNIEKPKSITFSCAASSTEAEIINKIANILSAKIYDSESSEFISL